MPLARVVAVIALTFGAMGCGDAPDADEGADPTGSASSPSATPTPPSPALDLVDGELVVEVPAGGASPLPGSDGGVQLSVGAIERGSARVTLARQDGSSWVKLRPMKPGDALDFDFAGAAYRLTLDELVTGGTALAASFTVTLVPEAVTDPSADG